MEGVEEKVEPPEVEGAAHGDAEEYWLYDSRRSYLEQLAYYKRHQGRDQGRGGDHEHPKQGGTLPSLPNSLRGYRLQAQMCLRLRFGLALGVEEPSSTWRAIQEGAHRMLNPLSPAGAITIIRNR